MGYVEKGLVELEGQTLLERKITQLSPHFSEIIVVTNKPELYSNYTEVQIIKDIDPDKGPLMGLYSGLQAVENEWCFVTAVDMPFTNDGLLNFMFDFVLEHGDQSPKASYSFETIIPKTGDYLEPLFGFYRQNLVSKIKILLKDNNSGLKTLLNQVKCRYITESEIKDFDPEHKVFQNINTLEDLERFKLEI